MARHWNQHPDEPLWHSTSQHINWAAVFLINYDNTSTRVQVCYRDCTYMRSTAANGGPCEQFFKATRMHCVRGSCSHGPRNKSCEYEFRQVTLPANGTSVTCGIGKYFSQRFTLNLTGISFKMTGVFNLSSVFACDWQEIPEYWYLTMFVRVLMT